MNVSRSLRFGATTYTMVFKAWQAGAGLIGILLVASYFEPEQQGFYYAFASLIALQTFLDLGLYAVVAVFASHEWSRLSLSPDGLIEGDSTARSRLVSLGRFLFKWYGVAAIVFWVVASLFGLQYFGRMDAHGIDWRLPWLMHVAFSSGLLWLSPFLSMLEGCDQYASTSRFRLFQSMLSMLAFGSGVIFGVGLWAIAAMSGVSLLTLLFHLLHEKRAFFSSFYRKPESEIFSWRQDLLPMQWRIAVQGLFTYFSFPFYVMLTFSHYGAVEGGRIGMTIQLVSAVQSLALVLITTRAPGLAIAVATGNRTLLNADWRRAAWRTMVFMSLLLLLLLLAVALGDRYAITQFDRVLPLLPFATLGLATLLMTHVQCIAIYLRAHKQERLTVVGMVAGLMYGVCAWLVVAQFGATGIAISHLLVSALVAYPMAYLIFMATRREVDSTGSALRSSAAGTDHND